MANKYAVASGLWSATSTWSDSDGGAPGASVPADGDAVYILINVNVQMDVDQSAWTGLLTVTVRGHATTPGMLYWKNGSSGYLKIRTGAYLLCGTTGAAKGRILVNSDGIWANTTPLAYTDKAVILIEGTSSIDPTYLEIRAYCTEPSRKYVRMYGTKYEFNAATAYNPATGVFDLGTTPPATDSIVKVIALAGGVLPTGLDEDDMYYIRGVSGNTCKLSSVSAQNIYVTPTAIGSGTCAIITGHTNLSTATINVLEDVTADTPWSTATSHNRAALVGLGLLSAGSADIQRVNLNTINASSIVLSANIDSIQGPGSRLYLVARNVSIRSSAAGLFSSTMTDAKLYCELVCTAGSIVGNGLSGGNNNTMGGVLCGFSVGIHTQTNPSIPGIIIGCGTAVYAGYNATFSGTVAGCGIAIGNIQRSVLTDTGILVGCGYAVNAGENAILSGKVISSGYVTLYVNRLTCTPTFVSAQSYLGFVYGCETDFQRGAKISGCVTTFYGGSHRVVSRLGYNSQNLKVSSNVDMLYWGAYVWLQSTEAHAAFTLTRNSNVYMGNLNVTEYNGVIGAHYRFSCCCDMIKNTGVVRTGGQASTIEVVPLSALTITSPSTIERYPVVEDWIETNVPATAQTRTIYIKGEAWSGNYPLNTELWFEADYLNHASNLTVTTIKSTQVLSDNTTWTALSVTFTPGQVGPVHYRLWFGKYAASCKVYIDTAIYNTQGRALPFVWRDGEAMLGSDQPALFNAFSGGHVQ